MVHPVQPVRIDPDAATAVSVTDDPITYGSEQSVPQLMPAGFEVTVPVPVPARLTVTGKVIRSKRAATDVLAVMATEHVPVPVQPAPVQPANVELLAGVAVSATDVPLAYVSLQSVPQVMPAGLDVTAPEPAPLRVTPSEYVIGSNRASTTVVADSVTVQVPVPEQPPPDHPAKNDALFGAAASVTTVPAA